MPGRVMLGWGGRAIGRPGEGEASVRVREQRMLRGRRWSMSWGGGARLGLEAVEL